MSSDNPYVRKFEELAALEEKAMQFYKYYVDRIEDPFLLERFKMIYEDECRHFRIAKELIGMLTS